MDGMHTIAISSFASPALQYIIYINAACYILLKFVIVEQRTTHVHRACTSHHLYWNNLFVPPFAIRCLWWCSLDAVILVSAKWKQCVCHAQAAWHRLEVRLNSTPSWNAEMRPYNMYTVHLTPVYACPREIERVHIAFMAPLLHRIVDRV